MHGDGHWCNELPISSGETSSTPDKAFLSCKVSASLDKTRGQVQLDQSDISVEIDRRRGVKPNEYIESILFVVVWKREETKGVPPENLRPMTICGTDPCRIEGFLCRDCDRKKGESQSPVNDLDQAANIVLYHDFHLCGASLGI